MDRLTALPPELLSNIASELVDPLGNKALFNLRLTCRQLRDGCDDSFIRACFGARWHLYSEHSLNVLCKISESARLRKRLTRLRLSCPGAEHMCLERHSERCHKVTTRRLSKRLNSKQLPPKKCGRICLIEDIRKKHKAVRNLCSEPFEAALVNLTQAGIVPRLKLCGYDTRYPSFATPFGAKTMKRQLKKLGSPLHAGRLSLEGGEIHHTLLAIARSRFPVADLNMAGSHGDYAADSSEFEITLAPWNLPWAKITRLSTLIGLINLVPDAGDCSPFEWWLASLHALDDFDIGFEWPENMGPVIWDAPVTDWTRLLGTAAWGRLAKCLENKPLTKLTLGAGRFGKEGILHILGCLKTRLRSLRLISSTIVRHDSSTSFETLEWIANNLELEFVEVEFLTNINPEEMFTGPGQYVNLEPCSREMTTADGDFGFDISGTPDFVKMALLEQIRHIEFEEEISSVASDDSFFSEDNLHWDLPWDGVDVDTDREDELGYDAET